MSGVSATPNRKREVDLHTRVGVRITNAPNTRHESTTKATPLRKFIIFYLICEWYERGVERRMSLREDKKVKRKENVINGQKIIRSKQMHEKFRYLLTL